MWGVVFRQPVATVRWAAVGVGERERAGPGSLGAEKRHFNFWWWVWFNVGILELTEKGLPGPVLSEEKRFYSILWYILVSPRADLRNINS